MPKTRLNASLRSRLRKLANELIATPKETAAVERTYRTAETLVRKACVRSEADEEVLRRYGMLQKDRTVRVHHEDSGTTSWFELRKDDVSIDRVINHYTTKIDARTLAAVQAHHDAVAAETSARDERLSDYAALVATMGALEDVEVVWPEAARVRSAVGTATAVSLLNDDVLARIKRDVASRQRQQKKDAAHAAA